MESETRAGFDCVDTPMDGMDTRLTSIETSMADMQSVAFGDQRIRDLFAYAAGLHQNYYVDATSKEESAYEIDRVKELLEMLKRVE